VPPTELLNALVLPEDASKLQARLPTSVRALNRELLDDLPAVADLADSNPNSMIVRLKDGYGRTVWYSLVREGSAGFVFSVGTTIQVRKELQTTEQSVKIAATTSSFLFWSVDIRSDRVEPLLRYATIWDAIGVDSERPFTSFIEFVLDGTAEVQGMLIGMRNENLESWHADLLLKTRGGARWFRSAVSASGEGQFNCFMLDITEPKETEIQLRRSKEIRDLILSHAKMYLWTFDANSCEDVPPERTIQMDWGFVEREVAEESRHDFAAAIRRAIDVHGTIDATIRVGAVWYSVRGRCSGADNRLIGICCDITDLTQAFIDLTREQVRAEAANQAKTAFLANMSHEIRTPMNGIIGMLDLLAMHELSVEQRMFVDTIRSSSFELMKQLAQTLRLSQIEKGAIDLNFEIFDISRSLEAVAVAAGARAKASNLKLIFQIAPQFPIRVYGESQLFLQIVNNLISNAMKFTKSGSISVLLNWESEPEEALMLDVVDTGIGMSDDQQRIIFNRFIQADPTIARSFGGTGLGLALVRRLTTELQGDIWFNSGLGEGTAFHVRLPFTSVAFPYPEPFPAGSRHEIAVVMSKEEANRFLSEFLAFYNYEIVLVQNLVELRKVMRESIEAVLVDIEHSGTKAMDIRNYVLKQHPNLMLSSVSSPGLGSDFPRTLTKPLLPLPLRQLLDDLRYHRAAVVNKVMKVSTDEITGKKVLVVEDNKTNQFVMSKMLTKLGIRFAIAENGQEALDRLEEDVFDLVFMDLQMPVMDGLEATRRIRASQKPYQSVPIVALTASAIEGGEEPCEEVEMNGYLVKPVRIQQITEAVREFAN
jgi:signal transduction histidine kinase/CheY-like chemotaxis protein